MSEAVLDKVAEHLAQVDGATFAAVLSLLSLATQTALIQRCASLQRGAKLVAPAGCTAAAAALQASASTSQVTMSE